MQTTYPLLWGIGRFLFTFIIARSLLLSRIA